MRSNCFSFSRVIKSSILLVFLLTLVIPPAPVQGWKSKAHVYLAEIARLDALDGSITLPRYDPDTGLPTGDVLGPYPVDPRIRLALQLCPAQYRAGALGPDAYPDIATGQLLTHPNNQPESESDISAATNSSQWINALWNAVPWNLIPATATQCTDELAQAAFATGYLTHAAGDMYGHTFINYFAGGSFDIPDNALQHVIVEGYVDELIPDDETPDFYNVSIDGAIPLIYDVLVTRLPGKTLPFHVTDNKANILSIPRFFNGVRTLPNNWLTSYHNIVNSYQALIDEYTRQANNCALTDMSCSRTLLLAKAGTVQTMKSAFEVASAVPKAYMEAWLEDIDDGLYKWIGLNHDIARSKLFAPDSGRPDDLLLAEKIVDYVTLELEPMTPLPDFAGVLMRILIPIGYPDFINQFLMWGDNVVDYVMDYDLYGGITLRKLYGWPLNSASLFDIVVMIGNGPPIYRQEFRREHLMLPEQTGLNAVNSIRNDATVQSLLQQAESATGEDRVGYIVAALDRAASLEEALTPEVKDRLYLEKLDYLQVPAMRNTVAMDKLIMISRTGMNQLLQDIGYRCSVNNVSVPIMLGNFMGSLDESDQGLDPTVLRTIGSFGGSNPPDNRLLMGLARDPVAYRTVLQLQEGHSQTVLGYLNQAATQCVNDPQYQACTSQPLTQVASYSLIGSSSVNDIQFSGDLVYLGTDSDGLHILDNPALLSGADPLISHLPLREGFYEQNVLVDSQVPIVYSQSPISVDGTVDLVYLSDGQKGLIKVDATTPTAPQQLIDFSRMEPGVFSSYMTDTYGMAKSGNRLYISAGYNGVIVLDVTAVDDLQEIDTILPTSRLIQNAVEDEFNVLDVDLVDANTLLVTTSRYLFAYNIDPAAYSPIMLAYSELPQTAFRTVIYNNRAYTADGRGGLRLYDISGVNAGGGMHFVGGIDVQGMVTDVAVRDEHMVFITAGNLLYRVNIPDIQHLTLSCPLYESARRIAIFGNNIYLGQDGGLKVLNFATP